MTDNKANKATKKLTQSLQETNHAIVDGIVKAQERNIEFAQNSLENGIEVLKSHAQNSSSLFQELVQQPQKPQDAIQAMLNMVLSVQERNIQYAQSVLQNGNDVLNSQIDSARDLAQTIIGQAHVEQDTLQELVRGYIDSYLDFFRSPFTPYQQTLDSVQAMAKQGVDTMLQMVSLGLNATEQTTNQEAKAA